MPRIIATTKKWIVVNKPAGWLSVPGRGECPCLSEWLSRKEGKIWVVHRLDRDTTGVILFARSAESHREANTWFSGHKVNKFYDFLAEGSPMLPVFRLNAPVSGQRAVTQVEVRESYNGAFLGRARPLTGRTHQIRIHLSGAGHPLLGDVQYGGRAEYARTALHAARLELPDGECYEAEWPEDFKTWVATLKTKRA